VSEFSAVVVVAAAAAAAFLKSFELVAGLVVETAAARTDCEHAVWSARGNGPRRRVARFVDLRSLASRPAEK
jgi:hypothetical protein